MAEQLTEFDMDFAKECASSLAGAADIGCVVSDRTGKTVGSYGYSCDACKLCDAVGRSKTTCVQSQAYGMSEAERFGGKYIYFCPMGLNCFVSPILGELQSAAKITVGPFLMVERQDFIDCELAAFEKEPASCAVRELENIPVVSPDKIQKLSTLLFMAVGFLNKLSAGNRLLAAKASDALQGELNGYIFNLKSE